MVGDSGGPCTILRQNPGLTLAVRPRILQDAPLNFLSFIAELRASVWYDPTSQAFAVFLPVRSVGVMGDGRTYE